MQVRPRALAALAVAVLSGFTAATSAARAVEAAILEASAGLGTFTSLVEHGTGERLVRVNGATLRIESGHEHRTLAQWLVATRQACEARSTEPLPSAPGNPERALWVEVHDADSALTGCLVGPGLARSPVELVAQLRALARHLDLTQLGELQVMRAEQAGSALHVVGVRSGGPLPLLDMFPRHGDAPGVDLPHVPRPPGARRLLSVYESGRAPSLAVYERPGSPATLLAAEAGQLRAQGFSAVRGLDDRAHVRGDELVFLAGRARGQHALLLVLTPGLGPLAVRVDALSAAEGAQPAARPHR